MAVLEIAANRWRRQSRVEIVTVDPGDMKVNVE